MLDGDPVGGQRGHIPLQLLHIDVGSLFGLVHGGFLQLFDQRFGLPNRQLLLDNGLSSFQHDLLPLQRQQRPGMTGRQLLIPQQPCHRFGQGQQTQRIRHGGTRDAHPLGGLLLGQTQLLGQTAVAFGLFHWVQVLSLQVFNERQRVGGLLVHVQHDGRDLVEACQTAGTPAAFTGDNLISIPCFPQGNGGNNAVFPDALGQILQRRRVKILSGLPGVGLDL